MAFKMRKNPMSRNFGIGPGSSPNKMGNESPKKMGHESPKKMGHETPNKMNRETPNKLNKSTEKAEKRANRANARKLKKAEKKNEFQVSYTPGKKAKKSAVKLSEKDKKKAMANAMPDAEVSTISKETMAEARKLGLMTKGESGGSYFDKTKARKAISDIGDWRRDKESVAKKQNIRRLVKAFS